MIETRTKFCIYLIGEPQPHFGGRVLPTRILEVLKVGLFTKRSKMFNRKRLSSVVKRICHISLQLKLPVLRENIVRKIEALLNKYRNTL